MAYILKGKTRRQKRRRKGRKKEEASQARIADRQSRIQQEAERFMQRRVHQRELVVCSQQETNVTRAVFRQCQEWQIQRQRILTVKECVQCTNRKAPQNATNTP